MTDPGTWDAVEVREGSFETLLAGGAVASLGLCTASEDPFALHGNCAVTPLLLSGTQLVELPANYTAVLRIRQVGSGSITVRPYGRP